MNRAGVLSLVLMSSGLVCGAPPAPTLTLSADRPSAVYACGEEAAVTIRVSDAQGGLLRTGSVSFTVDDFGTNRLAAQTLIMACDNPFVWRGTLRRPGFLRCRVALEGQKRVKPVVYGVAFDPCAIRLGSGGPPPDFDAYWSGEIARLDREVPLDARAARFEPACTASAEVSRVSFATFNGKRVHGFLSVPADRSRAPFPVRVTVPWAGPGAHAPEARPDDDHVITLVMNVHDFEPGPDAAAQRRKYDEQNRRYAAEVAGIVLRSAYENHRYAGYTDRTAYFYHDPLLGIRRAVLWVLERAEADRAHVGYYGRSQGGGLGMMLTALTPVFTRALFCQPAMADLLAGRAGRRSSWPSPVERARPGDRAAVASTAAYYDAGHFAARVLCESRVLIGFADDTCPPPCVYAAYNQLRGPKTILHDVGVPHSDPPSYLQNQAWLLDLPARATDRKAGL